MDCRSKDIIYDLHIPEVTTSNAVIKLNDFLFNKSSTVVLYMK